VFHPIFVFHPLLDVLILEQKDLPQLFGSLHIICGSVSFLLLAEYQVNLLHYITYDWDKQKGTLFQKNQQKLQALFVATPNTMFKQKNLIVNKLSPHRKDIILLFPTVFSKVLDSSTVRSYGAESEATTFYR
jgi:hypothetical protein